MNLSESRATVLKNMIGILLIAAGLSLTFATNLALAKRSGGDDSRSELYGIVQERPQKALRGQWVISGRSFTPDSGTEFDETQGPLRVGSCAKVQVRNGRVHEIDSEPMQDCQ